MEESGFTVVTIKTTHPGIRSSVFVFYSENEAWEFTSCFHNKFPNAETELSRAGVPQEVFPTWSF